MTSRFTQDLFGLMEIIWLYVIAVLLIITIPVWVVPYTVYKCWKFFDVKLRGNT